jgi:hypothetical protein
MPELSPEVRTPQQAAGMPSAVLPLPPATLTRRRRLLRWGGLATFILGIGLSAIPGPKGSSHTVTTSVDNGARTQIHQFFFSRHYGLPFTTGRTDYNDDGTIKDFNVEAEGFLGNLGAALVMVIAASIFLGRKRRTD